MHAPGLMVSQSQSAAKLPVKRIAKTDRKVKVGRNSLKSSATVLDSRNFLLPQIRASTSSGKWPNVLSKPQSMTPSLVNDQFAQEVTVEVAEEQNNTTESDEEGVDLRSHRIVDMSQANHNGQASRHLLHESKTIVSQSLNTSRNLTILGSNDKQSSSHDNLSRQAARTE